MAGPRLFWWLPPRGTVIRLGINEKLDLLQQFQKLTIAWGHDQGDCGPRFHRRLHERDGSLLPDVWGIASW